MNRHGSARTLPFGRALLVRRVLHEGWSVAEAAEAAGIRERTAYKWLSRYRRGDRRLNDRSSRPHEIPTKTPRDRVFLVVKLRREHRMTGDQIARKLKLSPATVSRILRAHHLSHIRDLEPKKPRRYEWPNPGDMLHLDTKKLGRIKGVGHRFTGREGGRFLHSRGLGWEFAHVAIDDASRVAYVEVLPDESPATCVAFLARALKWFMSRGVKFRRILSDNGNGYRSFDFADFCSARGIKHWRTRPYTPRTNGKAERFIQTLIREWAYARPYTSSRVRSRVLPRWLLHYNSRRPHAALGGRSPITRLRAAA